MTGVWETFANAPITEALLDIRVTFASPVDLAQLESFHDAIRDSYPTKQPRVQWQAELQLGKGPVQPEVRRGPEGFMFRSSDNRRIVQVRQDGFTFNWLKPYETWEAFRDEARPHWARYRSTFGPQVVTRLGLRYINRIELPLPFDDFRDFITTAPDIADGMPQSVRALFMRLEIPDPKSGLVAIVTETIEPSVDEGKRRLPFIFDIDVVRSAELEPTSPAIWETFEQMHDYKNEIFFASLTERAKEMFR